MVAVAIRTIFAIPDAKHVRSQLDEVAHMLAAKFPDVAAMLTDSGEDLLSFTEFPLCALGARSGRPTHSSGSTARSNGAPTSWGIFPNDASILRLVTAVLVETHDEWAVSERRYLSEESMAEIDNPVITIEEMPIAITVCDTLTTSSTITKAPTYTTQRDVIHVRAMVGSKELPLNWHEQAWYSDARVSGSCA